MSKSTATGTVAKINDEAVKFSFFLSGKTYEFSTSFPDYVPPIQTSTAELIYQSPKDLQDQQIYTAEIVGIMLTLKMSENPTVITVKTIENIPSPVTFEGEGKWKSF